MDFLNICPKLNIIRGETKVWKFKRHDRSGNEIVDTPTAMWFSMKKDYDDAECVLQKSLSDGISYSNGWWYIFISASETEALQPGLYVCDVKVSASNGEYFIVEPQPILVKPSATRHV